MTDSNEEITRQALAAWNRGDWEASLAFIHPDIEWRTAVPLLDLPQVSHGHDAVRAFWQMWASSWTDIRIEPEEFIPLDDGILALVRWRATSPAGIELDQPVAFHLTVRDGVAVRFVSYWDRRLAFEELGLPARG